MGLMMGFSPSLYGITFLALVNDPKKLHIVRWITLGIFFGATLLILIFRTVDPEHLINLVHGEANKVLLKKGIDFLAGLLLLLTATVLWLRRRQPRKSHKIKGDHLYPRKAVLEGFLNSAIGISSMATMYLAGRLITSLSHNPVEWWVAYCVFVIGMVGPYLILEASWNRFPRFAQFATDTLTRLKTTNLNGIFALFLAVASVIFFYLALH